MTAELAAAQQAAIDRIEGIAKEHSIECDFQRVNGYMFQGLPASEASYDGKIVDELYKAASDTGKLDVAYVDDARIPGFDSGKAIQFRQQGSFHPTKYIRELAKVIKGMGGEIYEQSRYMMHEEGKGQGGRRVQVQMADGQKVQADQVVMATNVPLQKVCLALVHHDCSAAPPSSGPFLPD
jgi:glycine/D-amino acid oxidase-like deaminating enzyme